VPIGKYLVQEMMTQYLPALDESAQQDMKSSKSLQEIPP